MCATVVVIATLTGRALAPIILALTQEVYSDNYFCASDNYKSAASRPRRNMLFRPKRPQPRVKGIWGERACWGVRARGKLSLEAKIVVANQEAVFAFALGAVCILFAIWIRGTADAIVASYLFLGLAYDDVTFAPANGIVPNGRSCELCRSGSPMA